jgi:hypothetical protein
VYELSGNETVTEVKELPSPGLPSYPQLLKHEHLAVLGYQIAKSNVSWKPQSVDSELGGDGNPFAIVRISSPSYVIWTPYSQEGIGKHPLAKVGLRWFSVWEVSNSPFIKPHPILKQRHLVFQFEDSTLDVVCSKVESFRFCGSVNQVAKKMMELYTPPC